jgi:hypothetical protein
MIVTLIVGRAVGIELHNIRISLRCASLGNLEVRSRSRVCFDHGPDYSVVELDCAGAFLAWLGGRLKAMRLGVVGWPGLDVEYRAQCHRSAKRG